MFASGSTSWSLPKEKVLNKDEVSRILARVKETDARLYVFLAIAVNTGLRGSEVLHLKAADVSGDELRIVRRKKKVLKPEIIQVVDSIVPILREWSEMYSDGWLFPGEAKPCWIKRSKGAPEQVCEGGHMALRIIQRGWEIALASLGLRMRGRGIHSLRHHAITEWCRKFNDPVSAQAFAGHSSLQVTQRYLHAVDMQKKVKAMEGYS